ncbi:MAG: hypothetical protein ACP5T3_03155 [Candidatus Micrarchaeia archaeon]
MRGKAKEIALAIVFVLALLLLAIALVSKNATPKSGCFNIPAMPTKQQVVSFLSQAYNGSECAIAAIKAYNASGVLSAYNITANMTKIYGQVSNGA